MNKLNRILTVILAFQIVVLLVVLWPGASVAEGEPLFGELDAEQIVKLTIRDASGQEIQLARVPQGWGLPNAGDFPAREDKVRSLLDTIAELRADRLVTRTRDSHARLQVADEEFQRLIEFELEDGTRHQLYLGTAPRYQVLHVRADDADEVFLVLGMTASDVGTKAADWVNTTYFSVPQDQIVEITLGNRSGRFEFVKDEEGSWAMVNLPAGETLLENNVLSLATRVSSLQMQRPLGKEEDPSYGLDDPNATVTVVSRDAEGNERTHIVRIGSSPEDETGYVVKSATSPFYVMMAEFTVKDLLEKTMESFIELPPPPVSEPTPEPPPAP